MLERVAISVIPDPSISVLQSVVAQTVRDRLDVFCAVLEAEQRHLARRWSRLLRPVRHARHAACLQRRRQSALAALEYDLDALIGADGDVLASVVSPQDLEVFGLRVRSARVVS